MEASEDSIILKVSVRKIMNNIDRRPQKIHQNFKKMWYLFLVGYIVIL